MAQHPEAAYWLALAYASKLKLAQVKTIVNAWCLEMKMPLSSLFEHPPATITTYMDLSAEEAGQIVATADRISDQADWLARLEQAGVQMVTRADPRYPTALVRSLPPVMQPLLLFCRGNVRVLNGPSAAVIGTQDSDQETIGFARELAALLAEEGLAVVGGLSKGIGQAAFDGAVSTEGGQTVALLPMGIAAYRPAEEMTTLIEQGKALLVSPFHPDSGFDQAQATARNKLIVGLAQAIFVTSANREDIVYETAQEALRMGKPVYVRHADAEEDPSADNHALVEIGALPIANVSDILDAIEGVVEMMLAQAEEVKPPPSPLPPPMEEEEAEEPFDPQAALDLLSQAGRVPDVLAQRLKRSAD
jgi:DNA protecting protein DprA